MVASAKNFPLLAELLAEQRRLDTPVARFSEAHDAGEFAGRTSAPSALVPLSRPGPREQYAFEVDLDSCTGCKACVAACHALNGLDDNETWRDVGLLTGGDHRSPFQQTITSACHHCEDAACLNGCPVLAYEKDPATGIVRHLDDQCIGCQYCILKCPYDAPKYSARLGIVRKCDMCHGRLAAGEAPACVQACPTEAIRIVTVAARGAGPLVEPFLAGAPEPAYTRPTTRYVTARRMPANLVPGDIGTVAPQPAHWPLAIMLTLMPLAVGSSCAALSAGEPGERFAVLAVGAGAAGLAASVFHLGQPLRAWRIFLGWRASWLSREAMLFGAWFPLAAAALAWPAAGAGAAPVGLAGIFCSAMIYADTRRQFWRLASTLPSFAATGFVLTASAWFALAPGVAPAFFLALATLVSAGLALRRLRPIDWFDPDDEGIPALTSARLLTGPLRLVHSARLIASALGGLVLPFIALRLSVPAIAWSAPALCLLAELLERHLFFRAVDAPKMPGMPGANIPPARGIGHRRGS